MFENENSQVMGEQDQQKNETPEQTEQQESQFNEVQQAAMEKGWKPLDQFQEDGGDPDKWRGAAAFMQYHEMQQRGNDEVKQMREEMRQLTEGFATLTRNQREKHKEELKKALAQAREDSDFDTYDVVNKQLNAIEDTEKPAEQPQQQGENELVVQFRQSNPMLDRGSNEFNPAFNTLVESYANQEYMNRGPQNVRPENINEILNSSIEKAKKDMPHLFQRQTKKPPQTMNASRNSNYDPIAALDPAAKSLYNTILKSQGKEAAETFAKSMSEE